MTGHLLVLLRHAKAEPLDDRPDFARALTARGQADAAAAGGWLADQGLRPDLVLCSTATRTRQTWQGVEAGLVEADPSAAAAQVQDERSLYGGGRTEVIDLLRAVPETVGTVLVVGHNPTVSDVSILLAPPLGAGGLHTLRTCELAVHRTAGRWSALEPGAAELVRRHTARS